MNQIVNKQNAYMCTSYTVTHYFIKYTVYVIKTVESSIYSFTLDLCSYGVFEALGLFNLPNVDEL